MTFQIRLLAAAVLTLATFLGAEGARAHDYKLGDLEIVHPWSRATPTGAKVAGGFLTILNHGAAPDRLVSVSAAGAGKTSIHEMATEDGVAAMRELKDGLEIPAHGEVTLKPGSYHLMFEDLKQPFQQGETIPGVLTFEKAGAVSVDFAVDAMGVRAPEASAGHGEHEFHIAH